MDWSYDSWESTGRSGRRHDGMVHRGHLVRKSKLNDRQRWDLETVYGTGYTEVEDVQHVGFTAHPSPGENVEVLAIQSASDPSRMYVIAKFGDQEKVLQVDQGSMAIYSPDAPQEQVVIKSDGTIEVTSSKALTIKTKDASLEADTFKIKANVEIDGNITQTGSISSSGVHRASDHV